MLLAYHNHHKLQPKSFAIFVPDGPKPEIVPRDDAWEGRDDQVVQRNVVAHRSQTQGRGPGHGQ